MRSRRRRKARVAGSTSKAAIRILFNHLVTASVLEHNPALSVKAPRQKLGRGETPVFDEVARHCRYGLITSSPK